MPTVQRGIKGPDGWMVDELLPLTVEESHILYSGQLMMRD